MSHRRGVEEEQEEEEEEEEGGRRQLPPQSITDAIWQAVQEQAVQVADGAVSMAQAGILYVAKEFVFALGDLQASDADDYGMTNDLSMKRADDAQGTQNSSRAAAAAAAASAAGTRISSKLKHKKKQKEKSTRSRSASRGETRDLDVPESITERSNMHSRTAESRDEEPERAYQGRVQNLIDKFDNIDRAVALTPAKWNSMTIIGNKPRGSTAPIPTENTRPTNFSQGTTFTEESDDRRPQAIFRPRTSQELAMDDSERFAYLTVNAATAGNAPHPHSPAPPTVQRPAIIFSPLVPFQDLHRANKDALLDRSAGTAETSVGTQGVTVPEHGGGIPSHAESEAYVESFLNAAADVAPDPPSALMEEAAPNNDNNNNYEDGRNNNYEDGRTRADPRPYDVRREVEEIQKLVAKLELRQQDKDKGPTQSKAVDSGSKRDPRRMEEVRSLVERLERLSERHEELKLRKARSQPQQQPQQLHSYQSQTAEDNQGVEIHQLPNNIGVPARNPPVSQ